MAKYKCIMHTLIRFMVFHMLTQNWNWEFRFVHAQTETHQYSNCMGSTQVGCPNSLDYKVVYMCSILQFTRIYRFTYPPCICTSSYRVGYSPFLFLIIILYTFDTSYSIYIGNYMKASATWEIIA